MLTWKQNVVQNRQTCTECQRPFLLLALLSIMFYWAVAQLVWAEGVRRPLRHWQSAGFHAEHWCNATAPIQHFTVPSCIGAFAKRPTPTCTEACLGGIVIIHGGYKTVRHACGDGAGDYQVVLVIRVQL